MTSEAESFAVTKKYQYFEISSTVGTGINEMMQFMMRNVRA